MSNDQNSSINLAHLRLSVSDLKGAIQFFEALGAKQDVDRKGFAVVELRDKTRLQLTEDEEALSSSALHFDFKVEDIDAAWSDYRAKGLDPTEITRRNPGHDYFFLSGPDRCEVKINSAFHRR